VVLAILFPAVMLDLAKDRTSRFVKRGLKSLSQSPLSRGAWEPCVKHHRPECQKPLCAPNWRLQQSQYKC